MARLFFVVLINRTAVSRGKFRSSLFKGLPGPPRSAVAARTRRNLRLGVSFLPSANREASCS